MTPSNFDSNFDLFILESIPVSTQPETLLEIGLEPKILEVGSPESKSLESTNPASKSLGSLASQKLSPKQELQIFASTFLTVFLAELGDKTQMATLLLSAQSQNPWVVFAGAGTALVLTSLIGVLMGRWLASRVSPTTLKTLTGVLLLLISVLLLWDVAQL